MESIKLVVVGDGGVGKTCLICNWASGTFPMEYIPTVYENYNKNVQIDGTTVSVGLWDTAGQEDYDRLRPLSYPETDIFVVLYSISSKRSFDNIPAMWIPEINHYCPGVPFVIVGSKLDLRDDESCIKSLGESGQGIVQYEEGLALAQRYNAAWYYECSALVNKGVLTLLEGCARIVLAKRNGDNKCILS